MEEYLPLNDTDEPESDAVAEENETVKEEIASRDEDSDRDSSSPRNAKEETHPDLDADEKYNYFTEKDNESVTVDSETEVIHKVNFLNRLYLSCTPFYFLQSPMYLIEQETELKTDNEEDNSNSDGTEFSDKTDASTHQDSQ